MSGARKAISNRRRLCTLEISGRLACAAEAAASTALIPPGVVAR